MFRLFGKFIAFIMAISVLFAFGIYALMIIAPIGFILALINYKKVQKLEPTPMICPNCGHDHIKITTLHAGNTKNQAGFGTIFAGLFSIANVGGVSTENTRIQYMHEAECQDCGYVWNFVTIDDVNKEKSTAKSRLIGFGALLGLLLAFFVYGVFASPSTASSGNSSANQTTQTEIAASSNVWATEPNPITDFDYYLDEGYVFLKEYTGKSKQVEIASEYIIDGKTYQTASTIEGLFALKSINSAIIPEGITQMANNTFNSCGVKYVYLPKSLEPNDSSYGFYKYFHNVEKIYYGGSKEDWAVLTNNADRANIDAVEIIYDASINDLK